MSARKLRSATVAALAFALATPIARADVGLGLFVGDPTALDLKLGVDRRSAIDIALGISRLQRDYGDYAHVTYLATLYTGVGNAVLVPLRLGIGAAVFDDGSAFGHNLSLAARAPFEIGLRFRRAPVEIYGEIALLLVLIDPAPSHVYVDVNGGVGFRVYF